MLRHFLATFRLAAQKLVNRALLATCSSLVQRGHMPVCRFSLTPAAPHYGPVTHYLSLNTSIPP